FTHSPSVFCFAKSSSYIMLRIMCRGSLSSFVQLFIFEFSTWLFRQSATQRSFSVGFFQPSANRAAEQVTEVLAGQQHLLFSFIMIFVDEHEEDKIFHIEKSKCLGSDNHKSKH
ncbi:MAG: hypothetical protein IJD59_02250, partial [Clostridia bacterium]|nr:hypothetical protein [Clostridia bacterium]